MITDDLSRLLKSKEQIRIFVCPASGDCGWWLDAIWNEEIYVATNWEDAKKIERYLLQERTRW